MKKINLVLVVLCIGIISIFGINSKEYSISNINYTEGNSNLIGKEVSVRGIDNVKFNIIGIDGKTVRLLSQELSESRYNYNASGDGDIPVAFENSAAYSVLNNNYSNYKDKIAASGGDTSTFKLDLPTVEEFYDLGYLSRKEYEENHVYYGNLYYSGNENTPTWLFQINKGNRWLTKSITKNGRYIYAIGGSLGTGGMWKIGITLSDPNYTTNNDLNNYGSSIRPVLETSVTNLTSNDNDVSFNENNSNENNDNNASDNVQTVKVPSTGLDAPIILVIVGLAVIIISGIIIWTLVKTNKGKKK